MINKEIREIEILVLSDMFDLEPEAQKFAITKVLQVSSFITDKAKTLYEICLDIILDNEIIDYMNFTDRAKKSGFNILDDKDLLKIRTNPNKFGLNYLAHINILREEKVKDNLQKIASDFKKRVETAQSLEDVNELRDEMLKELETLDPNYSKTITKVLDNAVSNYTSDYYKTLGLGKSELLGIDTGFTGLNKKIHGLRGLVILAGVPKTGKTSYILQLAFQSAQKGTPVLFYSLEMNKQQITTRMLSRLSKVPYIDILLKAGAYLGQERLTNFNELFTKEQLENFIMAEEIRKQRNNFYIRSLEDEVKIDFKTVEREIEFIKQKHNSQDVLVIIDHLQVFPFDNYRDQIDKEQNLITKFNEIQKKTASTIVLISQKNKEAFRTKGSGSSNEMAGVKGSVDLVYLASLILTLNESQETNNNPKVKLLELNIISRDTPGGQINLEFNGELHAFTET